MDHHQCEEGVEGVEEVVEEKDTRYLPMAIKG
jgi:hypothetical protein